MQPQTEAIEAAAIIAESLKQLAHAASRHKELAMLVFMLDEARDEAEHALQELGRGRPA